MESASTRESTQTKNKNKNIKSGEMNENNINEAWKESLMVKSISALLNEIISENSDPDEVKKNADKNKSMFTCKKPPSIGVQGYLERILKYTHIEDSTMIISLIFIDRLCDLNNVHMSIYNIHR